MSKEATTCKQAIENWKAKHNIEDAAAAEKVTLICQMPPIRKMDNKLNDLTACTHLGLSTNCIDRIQPLPGLKNLKILSLGRNVIRKFEKLDDVASTLEQLWVSYNQIDKLDGLANMRELQVLYMSNNSIKTFDELYKLKDLPKLNEILLIGNPIYDDQTVEERRAQVIKRLPNLKKLDAVIVSEVEREAALNEDKD
mmetsp:Transcript_18300/g.25708  ORF Transcript_18300/g.25708 Transcript_18300/m.25708 type:complete len:197 (-) Transcript_18300:73-663(-)|eukprot:CAMPEP_0175096684 /NCGR_PEP_ID=MMETSP0086_2-20121207/4869_1 /TAXON_ID=136419 /ORGANISM="Unknown Unknown, Strain D1" /LENGTH=196 /DNA_ID=CAMNT_0016370113 /DNA_START=65 /DNA_END=655 /DNA_ORIENTATION=+